MWSGRQCLLIFIMFAGNNWWEILERCSAHLLRVLSWCCPWVRLYQVLNNWCSTTSWGEGWGNLQIGVGTVLFLIRFNNYFCHQKILKFKISISLYNICTGGKIYLYYLSYSSLCLFLMNKIKIFSFLNQLISSFSIPQHFLHISWEAVQQWQQLRVPFQP